MGQPPHERTNHGDFHTHRQMKIKQKLTKTPTNMDRGKKRNKKHEKGSNKIGRSNFFSRPNTFQAKLTNKQQPRIIRKNYKTLWISKQ